MKDTPSPYLVTPEMVRAALDEHVQYLVPTSDINTPYRVDVQNALQGIADHINKAVSTWPSTPNRSTKTMQTENQIQPKPTNPEQPNGKGLDETPCSRFNVYRNFGHPWTRASGWDLLEIQGETEEQLSELITQAERTFWQTWVRDNMGRCTAVMYKPSGASEEWIDPIYSANEKMRNHQP